MKIESLPIGKIYARDDVFSRPLDSKKVDDIATSIKEIGLINPICVKQSARQGSWEVIAGNHRLSACAKLGIETIACQIMGGDDLHTELATIDENLCRGELSAAEEAAAISRRKSIYEELYPETKNGGDRKSERKIYDLKSGATPKGFTSATASSTGKSASAVQKAAKRGKELGVRTLQDIAGTSLDKGEELDALAKLPEEERGELIVRAGRGEKVSAIKRDDTNKANLHLSALRKAWRAANPKIRKQFFSEIEIEMRS